MILYTAFPTPVFASRLYIRNHCCTIYIFKFARYVYSSIGVSDTDVRYNDYVVEIGRTKVHKIQKLATGYG